MTLLAQLDLNESVDLEFGINIQGTTNKSSEVRFIIEGPDYGIVCKCNEENGVITTTIPKLSGILQPGTYSAVLEVIVGGKHFKPLVENIQFNPAISVDLNSNVKVKPEAEIIIQTPDIKVRMAEHTVSARQLTNEEIKNSNFKSYYKPENLKLDKAREIREKISILENQLRKK